MLRLLIACPYTDLVSICDLNSNILSKVKSQYDVENKFEDYIEMLEVINQSYYV